MYVFLFCLYVPFPYISERNSYFIVYIGMYVYVYII